MVSLSLCSFFDALWNLLRWINWSAFYVFAIFCFLIHSDFFLKALKFRLHLSVLRNKCYNCFFVDSSRSTVHLSSRIRQHFINKVGKSENCYMGYLSRSYYYLIFLQHELPPVRNLLQDRRDPKFMFRTPQT